ncbi:MAG: hypothetical protein Q9159_006940 [Coniocarpon cinnabarinum]
MSTQPASSPDARLSTNAKNIPDGAISDAEGIEKQECSTTRHCAAEPAQTSRSDHQPSDDDGQELKGQLMFPSDPSTAEKQDLKMVEELGARLSGLAENSGDDGSSGEADRDRK